MIEHWHAIMDALTMTVKGSTLAHAMFLLQTIQDDHYIYMCNKNKYPEAKRSWKKELRCKVLRNHRARNSLSAHP